MAGRIRDDDVALVRERSRLDTVVAEYVALKPAGGARLKGLCPFHDEKTPSFHVTPEQGYYTCFGCGEGGDVISFVRKKEQLTFVEAVEWLAKRANVDLRYEQGTAKAGSSGSQRQRLVGAHQAAAELYATELGSADAAAAREFLAARGFDETAARSYGLGFAPKGWDTLLRHLVAKGFSREELATAGLVKQSSRGTLIDSFRGRLVWPIRDISGDVVGFNARKLFDDDPGPKYLNSAESPIFKKSSVLYGLDKAKAEIARQHRAVIVEGSSDVMACHLAGVTTAVATCGTAFGEEHIKLIRRLLLDQDEFRGEVVFTFDGDAAGQKAAIKAFAEDQRFVAQTFVAVEPTGLDPCELRLTKGDAAVRELVARRVPLFEFVIKTRLEGYDLSTPEGQVQGLAAAGPVVASIKDQALRQPYAVRLAGWLGMDEQLVLARVAELGGGLPGQRRGGRGAPSAAPANQQSLAIAPPPPSDPVLQVERELLKVVVQRPALAGPHFDSLDLSLFRDDRHRSVVQCVQDAGGATSWVPGSDWVAVLGEAAPDELTRSFVIALATEPLRMADGEEPDTTYVEAHVDRLKEIGAARRIQELKSRLQRLNAVESPEDYNRLFGELVALEQYRRSLRERTITGLPT